jgi:hypothetical protein
MQSKVFGLTALLIASMALPLWAHHSHGQYLLSEFTVLEGTLKEVHYLNPHSWLRLEVKNESGQATLWALEADGPTSIFGNGVKKGDVVAGDTIKVRCHRLSDGSNGCLLGFVTPTHGDAARGHGIEREWD